MSNGNEKPTITCDPWASDRPAEAAACLNRRAVAIKQEARRLARLLNNPFKRAMVKLYCHLSVQYCDMHTVVLLPKRAMLYDCDTNRALFLETFRSEISLSSFPNGFRVWLELQSYTITFDRKHSALRERYALYIHELSAPRL